VSNNAFVGILKKAKLKASFMTNDIAVIHKERKSDFGVSFPDFPANKPEEILKGRDFAGAMAYFNASLETRAAHSD
jgi:hypothetical protein